MAQRMLIEVVHAAGPRMALPVESLSDRELEVLQMLGEGLSASEISERLYISASTVETHRKRIKQKLNLKSAGELNRAAVQWAMQADIP